MFQFKPKIPPRGPPKPVAPKSEVTELDEATLSDELLKNKWPHRFGYGQSTGSSRPQQIRFGARSTPVQSASAVDENGNTDTAVEDKEYEEPFNYYSYYPIRLPLRRPYSGNPEILDEKEFGEASGSNLLDEESINAAMELGLMEEKAERQMFLFQFPVTLPLLNRSATAVDKEEVDPNSMSQTPCRLQDLQAGFLGKMLIYEDGTIKMKIGDALFDVSPSPECAFAQDVCVINTELKHLCNLGELTKRAVVTPDIESMLDLSIKDDS